MAGLGQKVKILPNAGQDEELVIQVYTHQIQYCSEQPPPPPPSPPQTNTLDVKGNVYSSHGRLLYSYIFSTLVFVSHLLLHVGSNNLLLAFTFIIIVIL